MYNQIPKQQIDLGTKGDDTTGDIIYDGGKKLNQTIDQIYNVFGDFNLSQVNDGVNTMILHATGYYQRLPISEYISAIQIGSMHNISTADQSITIKLPINAKIGERVVITNTDNSWSTNALVIDPQNNGTIDSASNKILNIGNITITLVCTSDQDSQSREWKTKLEPAFGESALSSINITKDIINNLTFDFFNVNSYSTLKLIIFGTDLTTQDKLVFETLLLINNDNIYYTEYAVLSNLNTKLFEVSYDLINGMVQCNIQQATNNPIRVNIKQITEIGTL